MGSAVIGQGEMVSNSKRGDLGWIEGSFYTEGSEALHSVHREVVMPHPCRYPRSGDGAVSTAGAVGVPVHCRQWEKMAFGWFFPTQTIL